MKIIVEVNVDNAAFEDSTREIIRVLNEAGKQALLMLHGGEDVTNLRDINGNTVGTVRKVDE